VAEAVRIVHEAVDAGINFLDNAWEYHEARAKSAWGRPSTTGAIGSS
jgi:predicted aldo/keto reductase-like oxidoreductase